MTRFARFFAGLLLAVAMPAAARPPEVGDIAPDFELTLVDGSRVTLDELRGNVIVLNFWATWCVPCREELPLLDRYYEIQKTRGLKVFAITTENSVPLPKLRKLFAAMAMPSVRKLKGPYEVLKGVPTNYVIDRSGRVRYAKAGAFTLDELNAVLVPLLKEPVPAAPRVAP